MEPIGPVEKEQCMLCFDDQLSPGGVNVCLSCFGCFCVDNAHSYLHHKKIGHLIGINFKGSLLEDEPETPPEKVTKLGIGVEGGFKLPETHSKVDVVETLVFLDSSSPLPEEMASEYQEIVQQIKEAETESKNTFSSAWQLQLEICSHTAFLEQEEFCKRITTKSETKCEHCEIRSNLWLCLSCGHVGCGRQNFDGSGGNNHGWEHATSSNHPVSVKLGSISSQGTADVHCYVCDEERLDPNLERHLEKLGIILSEQQKTEASIAEMELEQNLSLDFTDSYEDSKLLTSVFEPGATGIENLGNSCYMSSVVQCLFAMDVFKETFFRTADARLVDRFYLLTMEPPSEDVCLQMLKLGYGIHSGRYGFTRKNDGSLQPKGIAPRMFKKAIARSHPEFSSTKQQDATEFLQYLLSSLQRACLCYRAYIPNVAEAFDFKMCQRLQCENCRGVRYLEMSSSGLDVPLESMRATEDGDKISLFHCLDAAFTDEFVDFDCPVCSEKGTRVKATKSTKIKTFPCILPITIRRFGIGEGWTPIKLRDEIDVPIEMTLSKFRMIRSNCEAGDDEVPLRSYPIVNQQLLSQLISMDFPKDRAEKALIETGNTDLEDAVGWLLEHPSTGETTNVDNEVLHEQTEMLVNMGFSREDARHALMQCDLSVERALDWLFSHRGAGDTTNHLEHQEQTLSLQGTSWGESAEDMTYSLVGAIVHLGTSTGSGHYVAYIYRNNTWLLCNDQKVAATESPFLGQAYMYFYRRKDNKAEPALPLPDNIH